MQNFDILCRMRSFRYTEKRYSFSHRGNFVKKENRHDHGERQKSGEWNIIGFCRGFFFFVTFYFLVERLFRILFQFIPEIRVRDRDHGLGALS